MSASPRVLAFGSFDPLHPGHLDFLRQAKALGGYLTVIVARDSSIRAIKKHEPVQGEQTRLTAVMRVSHVDEAQLGNEGAQHYDLLGELDFDIVALGYDQEPTDDIVRRELDQRSKQRVQVIRLKPFQPHLYKSSYLRG